MRRKEARGSVHDEGRDIGLGEVCLPEFLRCGEAFGVELGRQRRRLDVVVRMMLDQPQSLAS
jgi:hypothetical protein